MTKDNIGQFSIAGDFHSKAEGPYAVAICIVNMAGGYVYTALENT